MMEELIKASFQEIIDLGENVCCICRHNFDVHIDEEDIWRCHALGVDWYQCECALRKNRADNDISFYDLAKRCKKQLEELDIET
jgi:hypothetical protein